jgi:hypothetical protein
MLAKAILMTSEDMQGFSVQEQSNHHSSAAKFELRKMICNRETTGKYHD